MNNPYLKSPTSILNSIQRMKNNIKIDKQQLRQIKNNYIYLQNTQDEKNTKQFNLKQPNQKKTIKNNKVYIQSKQSVQGKQNCQQFNNIHHHQSQVIKQSRKLQQLKRQKSIQQQQQSKQKDNILNDITDKNLFHRNSLNHNRISYMQKKDQALINKNMKIRYESDIKALKEQFQNEKSTIINEYNKQIQRQVNLHEIKVNQMNDYIKLLQYQVKSQQLSKQTQKVNKQTMTQIQQQDFSFQSDLIQMNPKQSQQKYQHIINCLLQENTKLQLKIQKIYHSNAFSYNQKQGWNNYGSVSSRIVEESRQSSHIIGQPASINNPANYFSAQQTNLANQNKTKIAPFSKGEKMKLSNVYSSQVQSSNNYNSNQSVTSRSKKSSIIYRVSNIMQTSLLRQRKDSRTRISTKKPPVNKSQQGNSKRSELPSERQVLSKPKSQRSIVINNENKSNIDIRIKVGLQQNDINNVNKKKDTKFKFYQNNSDQQQILNDQMKLKTIKQFRCYTQH